MKVALYRGDTTKTTASLWIENSKEKVSKVLQLKVDDKFTEQDMTLPIQIVQNCDDHFKNGTYKIRLEGFGDEDEKGLAIVGNNECVKLAKEATKQVKEKTTATKKTTSSTTASTSAVSKPKTPFSVQKPFALSTIMFESTQKRAENLVPLFASVTMSITVIMLLLSQRIIS